MPKVFTVYGQTIVISDDFDCFNKLRQLFTAEAEKAAANFGAKYSQYGNTETLLRDGYKDGMSIISEIIQRAIISSFVKSKIYDIDLNRFLREFYQCEWGKGLNLLIDRYNELCKEIELALADKERYQGALNFSEEEARRAAKAIFQSYDMSLSETVSAKMFGKWGLSKRHRESYDRVADFLNDTDISNKPLKENISNINSRIEYLVKSTEELYTSNEIKNALQNEIYDAVMELWPSCWIAMSQYRLVNSSSIPMLNAEADRVNSVINNIPHMPQNDLLAILPATILSSPYKSGLYTALYSRLGDPEGSLTEIASYFGMSDKLSGIKIKILNDLLEILKPDFYESKASSAQARKIFMERSQLYGRSPEEARKILDDFISQARKPIEEWQKWQHNQMSGLSKVATFIFCFIIGYLMWQFAGKLDNGFLQAIASWGSIGMFIAPFGISRDINKEGSELEKKALDVQIIVDNWEDDYHSNSVSNELPSESDKSVKIPQLQESAQSQEIIDVEPVETEPKQRAEISSNLLPEKLRSNLGRRLIAVLKLGLIEKENLPQQPLQLTAPVQNYEPVTGITTDALIKRAFIFLEDGQFDDAGRYFNQALNQNPEDSRIHLGQLMLICGFHNVDELINGFPMPLDENKMFQRALRFASEDERAKLEGYAHSNRTRIEENVLLYEAEQEELLDELKKLQSEAETIFEEERIATEAISEQKRIADEAERERQRIEEERKRAEREAENERRYQEMLAIREKAASMNELEELLLLVYRLKPYRDSEQIYNDVNEALQIERKYQNALRELQNTSFIAKLQEVIKSFEELDNYKDSEKFLREAQSKLKNREEEVKRYIHIFCILVVLAVGLFFGWKWYKNNKDEETTTVRQNAMIAFFKGHYDEANEAINAVTSSADNPVFLNMLAYIKYDKSDGNYERFRNEAEFVIKNYAENSNNMYSEALILSNQYLKQPSANKFQGDIYLHGWGADRDLAKAIERFKFAADNNDIYSQFAIAEIYEGMGNNQEALKWYEKLAASGNAQAAEKVRELKAKITAPKPPAPRQQEVTLPRDDVSTRSAMVQEWYELGCDFLDSKNYSDAVKYFRLAANENYAPAQDKLGWMYQNGWGVSRSYSEAYKQYQKAAEQGNREAQASLGYLYYRGLGVKKDLRQALYWYGKSSEQGNATARRQYEMIERELADQSAIPSQPYSQQNFPVSAYITGNKVNVRRSPSIDATSVNRLNSGHPVSVSRRSAESDGDWYYVRTASGTEGWVKGDYVSLNTNAERTQQEVENRRKSLPARGVVPIIRLGNRTGNKLNLRNIPSTARTAKVITEITTGDEFTALERFAEEERDWYRIRTDNYEEGWVSGRFIQLR